MSWMPYLQSKTMRALSSDPRREGYAPKRSLGRYPSEDVEGRRRQLDVFLLAPNAQDQLDLVRRIRRRADDQRPVQEVHRDPVRRLVLCAADAGDAAVGGHDDDRSEVGLESAIEEGEAFDVEHMDLRSLVSGRFLWDTAGRAHLVDEKDTRNDLRLAFLSPIGDL